MSKRYFMSSLELKAVAVLLGVSYSSLLRGVTKRSKVMRGEITVVSSTSAQVQSLIS